MNGIRYVVINHDRASVEFYGPSEEEAMRYYYSNGGPSKRWAVYQTTEVESEAASA